VLSVKKRYGLIIHCRCRFVVGFGIDYNDIFRNLNHISILNEVSNFYAILLTQQGSLDNIIRCRVVLKSSKLIDRML
jgi:hypothetical protein